MDDEAKPYLLTEASRLTGLSVDALRKRIERRRLRGSRSNEDGQWRVWLTSKDIETAKAGQVLDAPPDESRTIKALEGETAALREALARERERADKAEREREEARDEAKALAVRAAVAETEAKGLRERAERAETRADRAEAEARRPFWRRWLGP